MDRTLSIALALLALGLGCSGSLCLPPVAGRWILAAGEVAPGTNAVALYGLGLVLLGGALASARGSFRRWHHPGKRPGRETLFALVVVVLAGAVALAGLEVVARLTLTVDDVLPESLRYRHAWLARRPTGVAVRTARPADRYDPELGWSPTEGFHSPNVNVTSLGLRGNREIPLDKPEGERRIVVAGDSFTWGENVADDEVYTAELDRLLDGTTVVNLGVHGYGTDQQYLRLQKLGFAFAPDLVIQAVYKTDAHRNVLAFRDYAKPLFRIVDDGLRLENVPVPDPAAVNDLPMELPRSWLGALWTKETEKLIEHTRFAEQWRLTRALLDRTVAETRAHGARFMLLYIPSGRPDVSEVTEPAEAVLRDWARERGQPFLDLRPAFLALPDDERRRLYAGHWTPYGHHVAAGLIADFVQERRLLDRSDGGPTKPKAGPRAGSRDRRDPRPSVVGQAPARRAGSVHVSQRRGPLGRSRRSRTFRLLDVAQRP